MTWKFLKVYGFIMDLKVLVTAAYTLDLETYRIIKIKTSKKKFSTIEINLKTGKVSYTPGLSSIYYYY